MGVLQGKGIWTLYDDIGTAVSMAPQVDADFILCKVSNHGAYAPQAAATALARVRANPDLHPVAYTYSYLDDVNAEAECLRRALADGFEAVIVDAEADLNGKFQAAEAFAQRVAALGLDTARLYLCSDPRLDSKIDEIPVVPLARACRGGFMPMIYGEILPSDRPNAAARVMRAAYDQYARHQAQMGYADPLLPAIATYWDNQGKVRMTYAEFKKWCDEAQTRQASFVSLFRAGVTAQEAWRAFRELPVAGVALVAGGGTGAAVAPKIVVYPDGPGYSEGFYPPTPPGSGWTTFQDRSGYITKYRATTSNQTMYATYSPTLPGAGRYAIEVFIPGVHATSQAALYFVTHYENGEAKQRQVQIDQRKYNDVWVPLGLFTLDPALPDSGRVNLVDQTIDPQPREIAFSAIRWRPADQASNGFDSPVGSEEERAGSQVWPGRWEDKNKFLNKYGLGYHTGADLNLNWPTWDLDRAAPVYSMGDGVVTFSAEVGGAWQALIVVKHDPLPDGSVVYSRYGHVDDRIVRAGDRVTRGQHIARIGMSGGEGANYHLHFDISPTDVLGRIPDHWPGFNDDLVRQHYVNPMLYIQAHRPVRMPG
jgi:murein DD-endopeptidase MepM/ murein hydrolase activator NlpD